jgi:hypothetical protein
MLASRLAAIPRLGLRHTLSRPPAATRRPYTNPAGYKHSQHPVPVAGPVIWAACAAGTIYFTCAAYDVWQDITSFRKEDRHGLTFDKIQTQHARIWRRRPVSESVFTPGPIVAGSPSSFWDNLSGPTKIMGGLTLVNLGFFGLSKAPSRAAQLLWASLGHTPALPWYRNPQLFTSMFLVSHVLLLISPSCVHA